MAATANRKEQENYQAKFTEQYATVSKKVDQNKRKTQIAKYYGGSTFASC